ncbi:hypothetical protein GJ700_13120 [Duganella sp. FT92W]|uniref:Uncharacterized protein n=1 Tax=Pseudoduganella rivuli TaxID=2666085 RepID=A0A7X2IMN6_9BURK|nr:hypothetical protein [Pseudoduganella rivuli]MRV72649.1 hypothetical protein [Pseudoduganella rivuli]
MKIKPCTALMSAALLLAPVAHAEKYQWDTVAIGGGGDATGVIPGKSERNVVYQRIGAGGEYRWDAPNKRCRHGLFNGHPYHGL